MKAEAQNRAIAEKCGWESYHRSFIGVGSMECWKCSTLTRYNLPPHYYSDLNACAEMEATLAKDNLENYCQTIVELVLPELPRPTYKIRRALVFATASQRCEAFLRVHGLWEEKQS